MLHVDAARREPALGQEKAGVSLAHLVVAAARGSAAGHVELAVSYSSKKGIPLVKPEYQNWTLPIF
jgi:hypothetical protein